MSIDSRKNSLWLAIQYFIAILFSFVTLKLNITNYGEELFGLWLLFFSFWIIGTAVDFGFGIATVKFIAEAKNDKLKQTQIFTIGILFFSVMGFLLFLIGFLIANLIFFDNIKIVPVKFYQLSIYLFLILGINFYFQFIFIFFRSVLEGLENFILSSKIIIGYHFINLLIVTLSFFLSLDILTLSFLLSLSSIFVCCLYLYSIKVNYKYFHINFQTIDYFFLKNILKFSFTVQFSSVFSALIDPVIKYILTLFAGLNYVSFYEVGRRFAIAISGLFFNSFKTILPKVSILKSRIEYHEFLLSEGVNFSRIGITYSAFFYGVLSFIFALIIKIVFNSEDIVLVLLLLSLPETINNFGYVLYLFLIGIGKPYIVSLIQVLNLIIIGLTLFIGFVFFDSILGLFGYYIAVIVANLIMLRNIKSVSEITLKEFLYLANIYKLLSLNISIIIAIVLISTNIISPYLSTLCVSIISVIIFYKLFYFYYIKFQTIIKQKYA